MAEGTGAAEPGFIGFVAQHAVTISVALGATSIFLLALSVLLVMRNNGAFDPSLRMRTHAERRLLQRQ
jgi:predicted membrane chloride channel (bestrophin family)